MRYPAEHKQKQRERIVQSASRHFRRGGRQVAIANLMGKLNLTHGGFYRHFASKEELFAEAVAHGFEEIRAKLGGAAAQQPGQELKAVIEGYLSLEHCANPAEGCPVAALGPEIARQRRSVRAKIDRAMRDHFKKMADLLPGATEKERERNTLVLFSGMVGALSMARSVADEDLQQSILQGAREFYIKAFCPQG
jgi:TetR/AcrR family transcriptional repressor of nem operon